MIIPEQLGVNCRNHERGEEWLDSLPSMLAQLRDRWSLRIGTPFAQGTCSWVAPVICADGTAAVLKIGMPHMECASESDGLRFWNGNPTVRLLESESELGAMLLERCEPGDSLRSEPEDEQDSVIATLLRRLWKRSEPGNNLRQFRHLSEMLQFWSDETLSQMQHWFDPGLVREALLLWAELGEPSPTDVLLATDLHAGNVLRSKREPWLVIDPKPFAGDRVYDVVQHLLNCEARLRADPAGLVKRLADLCEVDADRLQLWTFARAAADPRPDWSNTLWAGVAKALAP